MLLLKHNECSLNWSKLVQIGLKFYYLFIFSSWAEMETHLIGHFPIFPLTLSAKQVFILQFLQPLAEYQVESIQDLNGKRKLIEPNFL